MGSLVGAAATHVEVVLAAEAVALGRQRLVLRRAPAHGVAPRAAPLAGGHAEEQLVRSLVGGAATARHHAVLVAELELRLRGSCRGC